MSSDEKCIRLAAGAELPDVERSANATGTPAALRILSQRAQLWNKRTADGLKVALAYFNQAIEEDPKYAQAYSGLADTYALLGDWQYAVMTPSRHP